MKRTIAVLMLAALTGCAVPAETAAPPASGEPAQASGQGTSPPKARRWTTVATLKGGGDKRGTAFHLAGEAKLTYRLTDTSGIGALTFAVYVVDKGDSLEKSGGLPEVMVSEAGKDTTQLAKDAGDYYLDVKAANAKWSVIVQEKR